MWIWYLKCVLRFLHFNSNIYTSTTIYIRFSKLRFLRSKYHDNRGCCILYNNIPHNVKLHSSSQQRRSLPRYGPILPKLMALPSPTMSLQQRLSLLLRLITIHRKSNGLPRSLLRQRLPQGNQIFPSYLCPIRSPEPATMDWFSEYCHHDSIRYSDDYCYCLRGWNDSNDHGSCIFVLNSHSDDG